MILADAPQRFLAPAAAVPAPALPAVARQLPVDDVRILRRLRRIVRRRIRFDLAALGTGGATVSDGDQAVRLATVSPRDPRVVAWEADRAVALVVLNDGCGARIVGLGGLTGRIELPSGLCARAFLAFCYDGELEGAGA